MFVLIEDRVVNADDIKSIDLANIEDLRITVHRKNGETHLVYGIQTIDILMALKPSALESKRLKWHRFAWTMHNLVGHPLMQLAAFFRKYKLAMKIHDATIPRPIGRKTNVKREARG